MTIQRTSIKTKLAGLAAVSMVLVIAMVASARITEKKVDRAYGAIDVAQQTIQNAKTAIEDASAFKDHISEVLQGVMQLRVLEKTYLQFRKPETKNLFDQLAQQVTLNLTRLKLDRIQNEYRRYQEVFGELTSLKALHGKLKQTMTKPLEDSERQLTAMLAELEAKQSQQQMEGANLTGGEMEMMNVARDCRIGFLRLQNLQQLFLSTGDSGYVKQYKQLASGDVRANMRSLREFSSTLGNTNFIQAARSISGSLDEFLNSIDLSLKYLVQEKGLEESINSQGEAILKAAAGEVARADAEVTQQREKATRAQELAERAKGAVALAKRAALFLTVVVIGVGLLVYGATFAGIVRSINRSLRETIIDLKNTARKAAGTAGAIHTSSQALAEGSSQQAASLEETSSSLEEMAAMTRQNAENAQGAKGLANQARLAADGGAQDVRELTAAMAEIKTASDGISRIIKTIDEIAFQTNILALNAAEAGLGFAVVADEVRNLAQRAAHAARETGAKIEDSIHKSDHAAGISAKVAQSLQEIVAKARQVDDLIAQIAVSSKEQSEGISHLNQAVTQTDRVTQANATSAAESSSAAADLQLEAEALEASVAGLSRLVGSDFNGATRTAAS